MLPPTGVGVMSRGRWRSALTSARAAADEGDGVLAAATSADECATQRARPMGDNARDSSSSSSAVGRGLSPADAPNVDESADLVSLAQQGDRSAFAALFQRHKSDVARLIQRMIGRSPSEIEDLVQDVFLQVHRSIGDFRGQSRFSTWLYRITVNVVLMNRRARKSRPKYADEDQAPAAPDPALLPDEQAARNQRVTAFYALLEHLSEKKRQVFVLHELEGVSPQDISEIVDAPVLTVRTRLFYARKELASLLLADPTLAPLAKGFERKRRGDHATADAVTSQDKQTPPPPQRGEPAGTS